MEQYYLNRGTSPTCGHCGNAITLERLLQTATPVDSDSKAFLYEWVCSICNWVSYTCVAKSKPSRKFSKSRFCHCNSGKRFNKCCGKKA
jgi:hypothetical protein